MQGFSDSALKLKVAVVGKVHYRFLLGYFMIVNAKAHCQLLATNVAFEQHVALVSVFLYIFNSVLDTVCQIIQFHRILTGTFHQLLYGYFGKFENFLIALDLPSL